MSVQSKEIVSSRTISRSGDSFTASRTFLIYNDNASISFSASAAINHGGGVSFGMQHPEVPIFANGFNLTPSSERANTYTIVWNYELEPEPDPTDGGDNTDTDPDDDGGVLDPPTGGEDEDDTDSEPGDDGVSEDEPDEDDTSEETGERTFKGVSITTGLALVDGYVAGASIPDNGSQGGADGYLIADGTVVHQGGEPITVPVPTAEVSLSETTWGAYFFLNDVQFKAGKRNVSGFLGFSAGTVVFKGMSVQRQAYDQWDATYTFSWDAWSHMRQIPKRDDEGDLDWNDAVAPSTDKTLDIFFKQPFPNTVSFDFAP